MASRLFLSIAIVLFGAIFASAQEYIAAIKGTQAWTKSDFGSIPGPTVIIKNVRDDSLLLIVQASKDGHFDIATSPLGTYLSDCKTIPFIDTTLLSFNVGGKTYKDAHYIKQKALLKDDVANIEIWQVNDNGTEYSIVTLAPELKGQMIKDFIKNNLTLLPLPEVNEDDFAQTVASVNAMMQQVGGAKMSNEVKMTSAVANKENKEFIRTYQFYPEISDEDIELLTTNEATYSMVEYEVANTPLVKEAVELGYSILVVWNDKNGELIVSYKYDF